MLRFTKRSEYGLIAATYLAQRNGRFCPVRELIDELSIPRRILGEILRDLLQAGIVRVARGPGGGYRLRGAPDQISLSRLVEVLEGPEPNTRAFGECAVGACANVGPGLDELTKRVSEVLDTFTLAGFAAGFAGLREDHVELPLPPAPVTIRDVGGVPFLLE